MRHASVRILLGALLAASAVACGDDPAEPQASGPVDITFKSQRFNNGQDTILFEVTLDGTTSFTVRDDTTLTDISRGQHTIVARSNVDYVPLSYTLNVRPNDDRMTHRMRRPATCRDVEFDEGFCVRNVTFGERNSLVVCPVTDFGDFCTILPDPLRIGLTWPDSGASRRNMYTATGKLMIGALSGTDTLATSLYGYGDYAPRTRLHAAAGDSSRWQTEVWTDARHHPFFPFDTARLRATDRADERFGLSVRTTYYMPTGVRNALLLRFDVKNISDQEEYRFRHPTAPAGGHTLTDVYLAPFLDADVGGVGGDRGSDDESNDDNATMFPAERLLVVYDQDMFVARSRFSEYFSQRPGMVGLQLIQAPAQATGAPKGVILQASNALQLDFTPAAREDTVYRIIAGGRGGGLHASCTINTATALICSSEVPNNARVGWSVGPIPTLAPGQEVSLTVAIILAAPFTPTGGPITGTVDVRPQNTQLDDTNRPVYGYGANLRNLAAQAATLTVNGAPIPLARRAAPRPTP